MKPRIGIMIKILLITCLGYWQFLTITSFAPDTTLSRLKESSDLLRNIFMEEFVVD
jgi:hypothetical protein